MKRIVYLALGLLFITVGCQTNLKLNDQQLASEFQSLSQADKDWADACASKSVDRMIAFYDKEAIFSSADGTTIRDRGELRNLWIEQFSLPNYSLTWQAIDVKVAKAGDLGYTSGKWDMQWTSETGKLVKLHGSYVAVWKKQADGSWKVLVDKS